METIQQIFFQIKEYENSEQPEDRRFYVWGINEILKMARILYLKTKDENIKKVGLKLREIIDNYRIYPLADYEKLSTSNP